MSSATIREHGITISKKYNSEFLLVDPGPYARVLSDLVLAARDRGASDIHIEPTEAGVKFRIRVDGTIFPLKELSLQHRESLILEAKRVFGLSIGVSGKPQDGRISFPSLNLDLRVSLMPTHHGEKIVMRLLSLIGEFNIHSAGFHEVERQALLDAIKYENGVIVISGPTGSGKSKTLYSLLKELDGCRYNIVTLEDPIEYRIPGLNQVQISPKMSFANALRSVLRQDPDVILVGEVRDEETANLCFQAAETGHLVLTTLHANGAKEVFERLEGLGVKRSILQSNLRMSIAQRLEHKLCDRCKISISLEEVHNEFEITDRSQQLFTRNPSGCPNCNLGIRGRLPILEWATLAINSNSFQENSFQVQQTLNQSRKKLVELGLLDAAEVGQ